MRRSERGANLAEAALVLPLLALLLAAVVDLGRAFQSYIVITNAAREGARTGARLSCYSASLSQRTALRNAVMSATNAAATQYGFPINITGITIDPDPVSTGCRAQGTAFKVTVEASVTTFMGGFVGASTFPMRAQAVMSKIVKPVGTPAP